MAVCDAQSERACEAECDAAGRRSAYRHRVERLGAVEAHEHDVLARLIDLAELGLEGERHFGELLEPELELARSATP